MKAIVATDQAAGTAGMKLVERLEPQAANTGDPWARVRRSCHRPRLGLAGRLDGLPVTPLLGLLDVGVPAAAHR
jgi:hypothetical protein